LPFFFLKATVFCGSLGDLFGALFHVEKSTEEMVDLQRNHLGKKLFGVKKFFTEKFCKVFASIFLPV